MPPSAEPVDLTAWADPVEGFRHARDAGRLLSLPTSGTTSRPRRILRTPESWSLSFDPVTELSGIDGDCRLWIPGPLTATMNLFARIHAGDRGAVVVETPADATHAHLTPLSLRRALDDDLLNAGTTVIVAGDALPRALRDRAATAGLVVHHYYGASELSFVAWDRGDGLRAFPEVDIAIADDVIWVRSSYVCAGYDASSDDGSEGDGPLRRDAQGFTTVGDLGRMRDGVLTVAGRGTDAVTTAGVTVLVADVEGALSAEARGEVCVVGLPDERLGAAVVAAVTDPTDVERLRAAARKALAPAQRPARWFVVEALPSTTAGKVDRRALIAMLRNVEPVAVAR